MIHSQARVILNPQNPLLSQGRIQNFVKSGGGAQNVYILNQGNINFVYKRHERYNMRSLTN